MAAAPPDPPIRPLDPGDGPGPVAPPGRSAWASWVAMALGLAGLTVGLLMGLGIAADPDVPPTTGVTLSSLPPDLAAAGFVEPTTTTTTTTTLPPPTTTTTTRAEPAPPPTLEEMVPGLKGTMQLAFPDTLDEVWRWRVDEPFPERRPLPTGTVEAAFDAGGSWTAALAIPDNRLRRGGGLFLAGPDLAFQPFEAGVTAVRWHLTSPGRLAWTKVRLDGVVELWTGRIPGPVEDLRPLVEFGHVDDTPGLALAGWGDWGFAFVGTGDGGDTRLVTFDPDGQPRASLVGDLVALAPDGTMLVSGSRNADGSPASLGLTSPALPGPEPVDWRVHVPAAWSDDGLRLATVEPAGVGAVLRVIAERGFQSVLDTSAAYPVGWAQGDRFVVSWADGVRTRFSADPEARPRDGEVRRPALVFLDVTDRSVSAIAVEEVPSDIAFRVAS